MSDPNRPEFIVASQEAYKKKLEAAALEAEKQRDKEFKMMFNAMYEILGYSVQSVLEDGSVEIVGDNHALVWGNLAFNPITGWNCSVKPQFRFAVVDPSRTPLTPVTGWHIVDDLEDMGRYLSEGQKRLDNRRAVEATAKTIKPPRQANKLTAAASRWSNGTEGATDTLIIAIMDFLDSIQSDYYDPEDDDGYDED